jgi:hypothetical protein
VTRSRSIAAAMARGDSAVAFAIGRDRRTVAQRSPDLERRRVERGRRELRHDVVAGQRRVIGAARPGRGSRDAAPRRPWDARCDPDV